MNQIDEAYIGLDLHANTSVFGMIDQNGHKRKRQRVETDPAALNNAGRPEISGH